MADVSKAAVPALWKADPGFVTLAKYLYGESVTPEQIVQDVFGKMDPSTSDVHINGGKKKQKPPLPKNTDENLEETKKQLAAVSKSFHDIVEKAHSQGLIDDHGNLNWDEIHKAEQYVRDHSGRFASTGKHTARNVAGLAIAGGLAAGGAALAAKSPHNVRYAADATKYVAHHLMHGDEHTRKAAAALLPHVLRAHGKALATAGGGTVASAGAVYEGTQTYQHVRQDASHAPLFEHKAARAPEEVSKLPLRMGATYVNNGAKALEHVRGYAPKHAATLTRGKKLRRLVADKAEDAVYNPTKPLSAVVDMTKRDNFGKGGAESYLLDAERAAGKALPHQMACKTCGGAVFRHSSGELRHEIHTRDAHTPRVHGELLHEYGMAKRYDLIEKAERQYRRDKSGKFTGVGGAYLAAVGGTTAGIAHSEQRAEEHNRGMYQNRQGDALIRDALDEPLGHDERMAEGVHPSAQSWGQHARNLEHAAQQAGKDVKVARRLKRGGLAAVGAGGALMAGSVAEALHNKREEKAARDDTHEVTWQGDFSKVDPDKQQVFGWASVTALDGKPVVDLQGDYITPDEIEKAAYDYVLKSRVGGDMHTRVDEYGNVIKNKPMHVSDLIESIVFTPEKCEAMGISKSLAGRWWTGFQVNDPDVWADVKSGKRAGFSIHGLGLRKSIEPEELGLEDELIDKAWDESDSPEEFAANLETLAEVTGVEKFSDIAKHLAHGIHAPQINAQQSRNAGVYGSLGSAGGGLAGGLMGAKLGHTGEGAALGAGVGGVTGTAIGVGSGRDSAQHPQRPASIAHIPRGGVKAAYYSEERAATAGELSSERKKHWIASRLRPKKYSRGTTMADDDGNRITDVGSRPGTSGLPTKVVNHFSGATLQPESAPGVPRKTRASKRAPQADDFFEKAVSTTNRMGGAPASRQNMYQQYALQQATEQLAPQVAQHLQALQEQRWQQQMIEQQQAQMMAQQAGQDFSVKMGPYANQPSQRTGGNSNPLAPPQQGNTPDQQPLSAPSAPTAQQYFGS